MPVARRPPIAVAPPPTGCVEPRSEEHPHGRADQDHVRDAPQRQRGAPRALRRGHREGPGAPGRLPPELDRREGSRRRGRLRAALADRPRHPRRDLRPRHAPGREGRRRRRPRRPAGLAADALARPPRAPPTGRRAHLRAPDGVRGAHGDRGRQEPPRGARRGRGSGRPDPLLRRRLRAQRRLRPRHGQPGRPDGPHAVRPAAVRRLRRHQPLQLPDGPGRGTERRRPCWPATRSSSSRPPPAP